MVRAERVVLPSEMAAQLRAMGETMPAALLVAMTATIESMISDVKAQKMSGQLLGVRTGTARKSIMPRYITSDKGIQGQFGSVHRYVRAHELGFRGAVAVGAYVRAASRVKPFTRHSGGRVDQVRGHWRRAAQVRPHHRQLNIRARRFMASTVRDQKHLLPRFMKAASLFAVAHGRAPTLSELIAYRRGGV